MSRNSKAKSDKKKQEAKKAARRRFSSGPKIPCNTDELFNQKKLTAPKQINNDIRAFCKKISDQEPIFIEITPENWSRQSCCDLNVSEYIRLNGGEMVSGYKLWYHAPYYIEGERHAVWYSNGNYKDITFNTDGEKRILFVPDVPEKQARLDMNQSKIRWGNSVQIRSIISEHEELERLIPFQQMSDEIAWNTMLTYEAWQQGKRMPNMIPAAV